MAIIIPVWIKWGSKQGPLRSFGTFTVPDDYEGDAALIFARHLRKCAELMETEVEVNYFKKSLEGL